MYPHARVVPFSLWESHWVRPQKQPSSCVHYKHVARGGKFTPILPRGATGCRPQPTYLILRFRRRSRTMRRRMRTTRMTRTPPAVPAITPIVPADIPFPAAPATTHPPLTDIPFPAVPAPTHPPLTDPKVHTNYNNIISKIPHVYLEYNLLWRNSFVRKVKRKMR